MKRAAPAPALSTPSAAHRPAMLAEVLRILAPRDGAIYVDGTFGAGGYARGLLEAANCRVWGIDRDPEAIARGRELQGNFPGRIDLVSGRFSEMDRLLSTRNVVAVDGVALDLGVSSPQIDDPARGFSFRRDGPLDMRMERQGASAADAVNKLEEGELADIIFRYGEERQARRIARAIVKRRDEQPIARTLELAEIVRRAVGRAGDAIDPATRTFQALRIHVNDELGELDRGLRAAERLLTPGGRLAVVAFHSLEDRAVKTFLRKRSGGEDRGSRHLPQPGAGRPAPTFKMIVRRAMRPSAAEIAENPRARSARLRAAERIAAPPWPEERAA